MRRKQPFFRMIVWTVGLCSVTLISCASPTGNMAAKVLPEKPNILFIFSDDHALNAISCYGSELVKTPHIDRIASEGMLFEHCIAGNSICGPSRATILTGKHSHINGMYRNNVKFDGSQPHIGKFLGANGYQTALIGKWHLGSYPTGFDHWNILIDVNQQGSYFNPLMRSETGENKRYQGYTTEIITDQCIEWLDNRDKTKPFALLCHHKAAHGPWVTPEVRNYTNCTKNVEMPEPATLLDDFEGREALKYSLRSGGQALVRHTPIANKAPEGLRADLKAGENHNEWTKWTYQIFINNYCRVVSALDDNIGRLLEYLDQNGLADNTIVIYSSDQGYFLGEHGLCDKRYMYEESIHMPLTVRYPSVIKAGERNGALISNMDFAPTLLDYAGIQIPEDIQGRSIRPLLEGKTPADWRDSVYYHYYEFPPYQTRKHYGLRTKRYKLIHFYSKMDAWELFDLEKDPGEINNVYDDPSYADVRKELTAELKKQQVAIGNVAPFPIRGQKKRK